MGKWRNEDLFWIWLCLFTKVLILCSVTSANNFPPLPALIHVDRHWVIPEDEHVGTRIAQAKTDDDTSNITFSIEASLFQDGSHLFRIDEKSGAIYLNESLQGKKGKQFYLVISTNNGQISSKTEIWVQIVGSGSSNSEFSVQIPNKPGGFGLLNHGGFGQGSRPIYPPGLMPPPNAVTPPPPPDSESPSSNTPPFTTTQEITPNSTFPESSNNISAEDLPFKPKYPPRVTDSNKNTILHLPGNNSTQNHNEVYKTMENNPVREVETNELSEPAVTSKQTNATSDSSDTTNNIVIFTIVPIVLIFGVVPIVVASIWLVRKRTRVKKRPTKEMRKESAATTNSTMTIASEGNSPSALREWIKQATSNFYDSWNPEAGEGSTGVHKWEFPRHHLRVGRILGEGCFGQVWQCEALNIDGQEGITTVAVKTLKEGAGERERADLLSELAVMKMLDAHPHVVRLLGSCTEKDPIFLIMEYVSLGKLQSYLRNSRSNHYYPNLHGDSGSISSKDLTAFCYQIARGMEYLSSKGIIHRDLAARNILIDKDRVCKVADFGFARDVVANHVYERKTDGRLPVRWMAPEALYDNIFTTKTDIWSFGVLMWEIVTLGSTPYPGISAAEVMRKVREGYRLEKPEHCRRELYNIMYYCWAQNPDDRPTFSDLVNFLKHLLFSETDYIELDRFPDHDYYNYMTNQTSGEKI